MTLTSTLYIAKNALYAAQAGIQVAANNIANADTPGYVREKLIQAAGPTQRIGDLVTGTGVVVKGVVREVDEYLQERLRAAGSDKASGEAQEAYFVELESVIGELTDSDLSTAVTTFFNRLHDVLNQPEDPAVRNMAVLAGDELTAQVRNLDSRVRALRKESNEQIVSDVDNINQLVKEIAELNVRIIEVEKGGQIVSDAVGLRDERDQALKQLASLVNITVDEQTNGSVNVFVGGDYLVFDGATQTVKTVQYADRGLISVELRLSRSDGRLRASSGEVAGLIAARDDILGGFLDRLDTFAGTLINEFNKVHSSGQGLSGYQELLSAQAIADSRLPLDEAGLAFTPVHGSFQVEVYNRETGTHTTHDIFVQLDGLDDDTTLASLTAALDAIDGLSAAVTVDGQLRLESESPVLEFSFARDTSGTLAALGGNTFFTGTKGSNMRLNEGLLNDASKLALSSGGIGSDTRNGESLAALLTTPLESTGQLSLTQVYERWMGETAQASALAQAVADGYRSFHSTLEGEHLGFSGVNLDEEAVNMMVYQQTFQVAAKVISTISELLEVLTSL